MFDHFTDRARMVMGLARQEAERLHHDAIGTEHLLLGLVEEGSGVAASVLKSLDVDAQAARAEVERRVSMGPETTSAGQIPFTPGAQKVLELGIEEASNLGHGYVGTEHLLLALIREDEGIGAQVLKTLGAELHQVRDEVMGQIGADDGKTGAVPSGNSPVEQPLRDRAADIDREIAAVDAEKAAAVAVQDFDRAARLRDRGIELRAERERLTSGAPGLDVLRNAARVARGAAVLLQDAVREIETLQRKTSPDVSAAPADHEPVVQALHALARVMTRHPGALDRILRPLEVSEARFVSAVLDEVSRLARARPGGAGRTSGASDSAAP
jgi:ATP-dependent Clp protease ATP-binding subunit ClpA